MRCFSLLCVALALGGVTNGIAGGPLMALLDDSVEAGFRSDMEMYYSTISSLASIAGPVVALVSFAIIGNSWSLGQMKTVIYMGCVATIPCAVLCFFFDDRKALGKESDSVERIEAATATAKEGGHGASGPAGAGAGGKKVLGFVTERHIPWFLFLKNLFASVGAGMTVKFFPLFFTTECGLSPIQLQVVYLCLPVIVAAGTVGATKVAKRAGRMQVTIPCDLLGICMTMTMSLARPFYGLPYVMIPIYLVRCGFMWSTLGLSYSIIADYVPKEYRARWNTLESIASFGWSGSAVLGGHLVAKHGYSVTFAITASVQLLGVLLFALPLLPLVAKESDIQKLVETHKQEEAEDLGSALEEPLLPQGASTPLPIRGLPGVSPTYEEVASEQHQGASLSRSLNHLENVARFGSLG